MTVDAQAPTQKRQQRVLRLVDSVAELSAADAGCVAVTASHGGISAARYALAVRPALTVFNDAGVGLREAGVAALPLMQAAGLAACTVAHTSACIGQAQSTWDTGVVSHANEAAQAWGVCVGQPLKALLADRTARQHHAPGQPTDAMGTIGAQLAS